MKMGKKRKFFRIQQNIKEEKVKKNIYTRRRMSEPALSRHVDTVTDIRLVG